MNLHELHKSVLRTICSYPRVINGLVVFLRIATQGGESTHGLTQNSWFNSCHGLFYPLTLIINTNTVSLKQLRII